MNKIRNKIWKRGTESEKIAMKKGLLSLFGQNRSKRERRMEEI